ncbi:MAG: HK97 family phage prohead protease [Planctomycetota bacterium]
MDTDIQTKYFQGVCKAGAVDGEKRQIRFLASTGDTDRDGEIILPSAFKADLNIFMSNPVFLAAHQHRLSDGTSPVIGKIINAWIDKTGFWVVVEFAQTQLAEEYWQLYRDGYMRAVSIGFIPKEWKDTANEGGRTIRTFTRVELLEISAVAVPSNRAALSKSRQRKADFVDAKRQEKYDLPLDDILDDDEDFGSVLLSSDPVGEDCFACPVLEAIIKGVGLSDDKFFELQAKVGIEKIKELACDFIREICNQKNISGKVKNIPESAKGKAGLPETDFVALVSRR